MENPLKLESNESESTDNFEEKIEYLTSFVERVKKKKWDSVCTCHVLFFVFLIVLLVAIWLGFYEPLDKKHWTKVNSQCMVVDAKMVFIQGVIGNVDIMGAAELNYTNNKNEEVVASLSRTLTILLDKETEANFIAKMLKYKTEEKKIDCWVDVKDPYRVSLTGTPQPDGFIVFQTIVISVLLVIETIFTIKLITKRKLLRRIDNLSYWYPYQQILFYCKKIKK
ncbi:hypothetical protein M0813_17517 [Anaeramoeba flamelloides]|uniref:Uncharacterized protein n=1 Tax=Anaeramoeba flamelloides TaxID=1746091 RepID=A0ABQ8YVH6_9EUKA|nr:hypothetical protein M0813_17517 [Anaeramoeba flamelloides]